MLSDHLKGRDNNYNLVRACCALFIALYHCYFMTYGNIEMRDVNPAFYYSAQTALNIFFIISGFLIYQSFERRKGAISYWTARFMRIIPGVFLIAVISALILGPISSKLPFSAYLSDLSVWKYIGLTTALYPDAKIADVFATNPSAGEMNEALWTLRYEFLLYGLLFFAGILGFLKNNRIFNGLALLAFIAYIFVTYFTDLRNWPALNHLIHFTMSFLIGMVFYKNSTLIALKLPIVVTLILAAGFIAYFADYKYAEILILMATAYAVFYFVYIPDGILKSYRNLGDYSYGIYIMHVPIEQMIMQFIAPQSMFALYAMTIIPLIIAAVLSWHYWEKPALKMVPKISETIGHYISGNKALAQKS